MSNNIFLSTTCFNYDCLEEIIKISKENGVYNLEISGGLKYLDPNKYEEIFEKNKEINFRFHNYFPIPKNSFVINLANEKTANISIDNIFKGMKFAKKFGSNIFSVHAGLRFNPLDKDLGTIQKKYKSENYHKSYKILEKSIDKISKNNFDKTIICLENNVVEKRNSKKSDNRYILSDLSDLEIIKKLILKYKLNILLDVAHLKVSSETLEFDKYKFIEEYYENILVVHLSENNGVLDLGNRLTKKSWFWNYLNWKKIKYVSLEIKNTDMNNLKKQIELTSKLINK